MAILYRLYRSGDYKLRSRGENRSNLPPHNIRLGVIIHRIKYIMIMQLRSTIIILGIIIVVSNDNNKNLI